jgi:Tfp pilus assembly pilus retraction ATPase PilT
VRDAIRESRLGELANLMNSGEHDMSSFTRHANALVDSGTITKETAKMVQADSGANTHGSGTGGSGGKRRKGD